MPFALWHSGDARQGSPTRNDLECFGTIAASGATVCERYDEQFSHFAYINRVPGNVPLAPVSRGSHVELWSGLPGDADPPSDIDRATADALRRRVR